MRAGARALQKQAACCFTTARPIRVQRLQRVQMSAQAKQVISTDQAPAALGPYSQVGGVRVVSAHHRLYQALPNLPNWHRHVRFKQIMYPLKVVCRSSGCLLMCSCRDSLLMPDRCSSQAKRTVNAGDTQPMTCVRPAIKPPGSCIT